MHRQKEPIKDNCESSSDRKMNCHQNTFLNLQRRELKPMAELERWVLHVFQDLACRGQFQAPIPGMPGLLASFVPPRADDASRARSNLTNNRSFLTN
jgi:hypothetical protein